MATQKQSKCYILQNEAHINMQENNGFSSLMIASQKGHAETVQMLIAVGAEFDLQSKEGNTALMLAILNNNGSAASLLLDCGANVNLKNKFYLSVLSFASMKGQLSVVEQILSSKAPNTVVEIDHQDYSGNSSLMYASLLGHSEIVESLLSAGALVNTSNFSNYLSLHQPLNQMQPLSAPQDRDLPGTALDKAVIRGNTEIVSLLLEHGAKVYNLFYLLRTIILMQTKENHDLVTSNLKQIISGNIHNAKSSASEIWKKYDIIIQVLFAHDSNLLQRVQCTKPSVLFLSCAFGVTMFQLLIQLGVDVSDLYRMDDMGSTYWTCLIRLISSSDLLLATSKASTRDIADVLKVLKQVNWIKYSNIISMLIDNGLNINYQDGSGSCALSIASAKGHAELVQLLLKSKADVNLQDKEGMTSLMEASTSGRVDICRLLLRYNSAIDLQDSKGWSALMMAVAGGFLDIILLLLERGSQVNIQDNSGTSALMLSCLTGQKQVTKVLLMHGAEVNLQNAFEMTALMLSSHNGHLEIEELLLKNEAEVNIETSIGMTALKLSTDNGHSEIAELLMEHGAGGINRRVRKRPSSTRYSKLISNSQTYDSGESRLELRVEKSERALQLLASEESFDLSLMNSFRTLLPLAYDWFNIGILLNLEYYCLKNIEYNYKRCQDCLREMLSEWHKRVDPPPSWEELAGAVELTDQGIARKIREKT